MYKQTVALLICHFLALVSAADNHDAGDPFQTSDSAFLSADIDAKFCRLSHATMLNFARSLDLDFDHTPQPSREISITVRAEVQDLLRSTAIRAIYNAERVKKMNLVARRYGDGSIKVPLTLTWVFKDSPEPERAMRSSGDAGHSLLVIRFSNRAEFQIVRTHGRNQAILISPGQLSEEHWPILADIGFFLAYAVNDMSYTKISDFLHSFNLLWPSVCPSWARNELQLVDVLLDYSASEEIAQF